MGDGAGSVQTRRLFVSQLGNDRILTSFFFTSLLEESVSAVHPNALFLFVIRLLAA